MKEGTGIKIIKGAKKCEDKKNNKVKRKEKEKVNGIPLLSQSRKHYTLYIHKSNL